MNRDELFHQTVSANSLNSEFPDGRPIFIDQSLVSVPAETPVKTA